MDKTINDKLRSCTTYLGLTTGNMDKLKATSNNVCRVVKDAKQRSRRKQESQFEQGGSRSL